MQSASERQRYRRRLKKALDNQFLRQTLDSFTGYYRQRRQETFGQLDFEAMRQAASQAKEGAISRPLELYEEFKRNAEAAGAKVHLAADAAEANRIITQIARDAGCTRIVKSKSMTSEEIFLNDHLQAAGLKVTETDLGEWIIQLRHERPSHMVAPAIHLSAAEVANLFQEVTGQAQDPTEIGNLVKVARAELRRAFLQADMGISGANFAVASRGAIGIVTNEGNARLVTTLPRVHVALVGLDKLLPDMRAALDILELLPRNAANQVISSYVTWIAGANPCQASEDGQKETHLVFLDNGRLALAEAPDFREALRCVRCGACANVCPIYGLVGGHEYGHIYMGAIGLILTHFFHGSRNAHTLVNNCLNCQACKDVCAVGIDLPRLIKKTAALIHEQDGTPAKTRLMRRVLKNRRLFHALLRRAYLAQKPLARGGDMIRHLPAFFGPEHNFRSLPVVSSRPLRDRWAQLAEPVPEPKLKVALFGGCLVDFVYPGQAEALVELVKGRGIKLDYPLGQTCCGLPAAMAAEEDLAAEVARQNLAALDPEQYDQVLVLCASCGSHIKNAYPQLLADDPVWGPKARQMADKFIDFSSFASEMLGLPEVANPNGLKAAYHAPCHLCRGLDVKEAPRDLLRRAGYEYAPYEGEEVCCGFGGSYSLDFPEISAKVLERKLDAVEQTGADVLVTDCPGCVLQLAGGLDQRGSPVKVLHMAQALIDHPIKES